MAGQFDHLVGELSPGDHGWLPLDEAGNPTGPATLQPPPPPALACAVYVTAEVPLPEGHDLLVSETGAPLIPPLTSNVDRRDPGSYVPPISDTPVIESIDPAFAELGSADFILTVTGDGFSPNCVINFDDQDMPTEQGSGSVSTSISPILWSTPGMVSVLVKNEDGTPSGPMNFEFTAAGGARRGKTEQGRRRD